MSERGWRLIPFGDKYDSDKADHADHPCVVCGRNVNVESSKAVWVAVGGGGSCVLPYDHRDWADDPGYMGIYPVGPECSVKHRKYLKSLGY